MSASNKLRFGPELVLGQPFGLRDDSFGLDCSHAGKQLCLFICFDPFLSAAGFLEDYFWGLHMHLLDSHQRVPGDKVAASLSFNYLVCRPAFECRSSLPSKPACHLFEIKVTRWIPGVSYEGAIELRHPVTWTVGMECFSLANFPWLSRTCPWKVQPATDAIEILPAKVVLIINAGPSVLAELQDAVDGHSISLALCHELFSANALKYA